MEQKQEMVSASRATNLVETADSSISYQELRTSQRRRVTYGWINLGFAAILFALAMAVFAFNFWLVKSLLWNLPQARRVSQVPLFICIGIATYLIYLSHWQFLNARRHFIPDGRLAVLNDRRAPVLYLRSFEDDESRRPDFGVKGSTLDGMYLYQLNRHRYEEDLARSINRCIGPFIAIGRPGETLPELGAFRLYASQQEWQSEVVRQMELSRLVVIRIGTSAGLLWELNNAITRVPPEKLILYQEPPRSIPQEILQAFSNRTTHLPASRFIYFDSNWTPCAADTFDQLLVKWNMFIPDRARIALYVILIIGVSVWISGVLLYLAM